MELLPLLPFRQDVLSQQVRDLTQIGCDIFQGFYYSRPVPVADFEERFPDGLARPWSEPVQAEK